MTTKIIKFIVLSILLIGCSTVKQSSPMPSENIPAGEPIRLYTFDCGSLVVSDLDVFSSSGDYVGESDTFTNTCYLIRHPKGDLIWDLGLPLSLVGTAPKTSGIFTNSLEKSLKDQLTDIQLTPEDIEFISISHSHFDHTGQVSLFPNAEWLVNKNEFDYMFGSTKRKIRHANFAGLSNTTYTGNYDVYGDGSVVIIELPGHTPGHSGLQINLAESGPILLTGDLYHRSESRELKRVPRFNTDKQQTRKSMAVFEALAIELEARVIIQHEKEDIAALPKLPKFLQ